MSEFVEPASYKPVACSTEAVAGVSQKVGNRRRHSGVSFVVCDLRGVIMYTRVRALIPGAIVVVLLVMSARAQAGFINGVETLDGVAKDFVTWEEFNSLGNTIVQHDLLTF